MIGTTVRGFIMKANRFKGPLNPMEYRGYKARVRIIGVSRKD
jgi:hypothetical protein